MTSFDPSLDWLADAALTPDQRRAWNMLRTELAATQAKNLELKEKVAQLELRVPDPDHAVLTRPDFNREVARMLAFDERYGGVSSVLYFNFDHVEEAAMRYGRSVANAALRQIGQTLILKVRTSDIVGRLAPDEFGVLLARCDNVDAWKKAEMLATFLHQDLQEIQGCAMNIRISYGAYTFRDKDDLAQGLREAAQSVTKTGH